MNEKYILLDLNWCNSPVARDPRSKQVWKPSKRGGMYHVLCKNLHLHVDDGADARVPSGFDMNVLFYLLREARLQKQALSFKSLRDLMLALDLPVSPMQGPYIQMLKDSLYLWSRLNMRWQNFYCWQTDATIRLPLKPPLIWSGEWSFPMTMEIHDTWDRFYKDRQFLTRVRGPLPIQSAVQNTVLQLIARRSQVNYHLTKRIDVNDLDNMMTKVGLSHAHRLGMFVGPVPSWVNSKLGTIMEQTVAWFRTHGGDLEVHVLGSGKLRRLTVWTVMPRGMRQIKRKTA